ncbi:hypothetical protein Taro_009283 [Colocasia esculenta]|uniref:Uncharacterized protein n=1 Tax=Colocasia esculenta TaxID=4460 RepID=A0A843U4D0_COLES|nr:hypothetical protein [Colocasia esculenta]
MLVAWYEEWVAREAAYEGKIGALGQDLEARDRGLGFFSSPSSPHPSLPLFLLAREVVSAVNLSAMGRYRSRSRSHSPRRLSRSPPRRKHYDDPRDRFRGGRGFRDRRASAPSGLLIRNLPLDASGRYMGGRRGSPPRSPRPRYRSYSRSPSPPVHDPRHRDRGGEDDYYPSQRSTSASPHDERNYRSHHRSPSPVPPVRVVSVTVASRHPLKSEKPSSLRPERDLKEFDIGVMFLEHDVQELACPLLLFCFSRDCW